MSQEKERILKMLEDGKISAEECRSLLTALGEDKAATEPTTIKPVWIILAVFAAVLMLGGWFGMWRSGGGGPFNVQLGGFLSPVALLALFLIAACFYVAALFNCIRRKNSDFPRLFVEDGKYDKLIWLGIILAGSILGAAAYMVMVAWNSGPRDRATDDAYVPPPRASSLRWLISASLALSILVATAYWVRFINTESVLKRFAYSEETARLNVLSGAESGPYGGSYGVYSFPFWKMLSTLFLVSLAFWVWMMIDAAFRDPRDFASLHGADGRKSKLTWFLVTIFGFVVGAIAYHRTVRRRTWARPPVV